MCSDYDCIHAPQGVDMASPRTLQHREKAFSEFMYKLRLAEMSRQLRQEAWDNNLANKGKKHAL